MTAGKTATLKQEQRVGVQAFRDKEMTNNEMCIQCGWVGSYRLNSNTGDGGHCPDCGADVQDYDKREYDNIFAIPFTDKVKNYGMYLLRVAGITVFLYGGMLTIFGIDAVIGGSK